MSAGQAISSATEHTMTTIELIVRPCVVVASRGVPERACLTNNISCTLCGGDADEPAWFRVLVPDGALLAPGRLSVWAPVCGHCFQKAPGPSQAEVLIQRVVTRAVVNRYTYATVRMNWPVIQNSAKWLRSCSSATEHALQRLLY